MAAAVSRKFFVGGNWKAANGTFDNVQKLIKSLNDAVKTLPTTVDVCLAPTFIYLDYVKRTAAPYFLVSAQNCWHKKGAFTGEVTADQLHDFGINWVILGHSERRHVILEESDDLLCTKTVAALANGLSVMFCIGELEKQREEQQTEKVLAAQMEALKKALGADAAKWSKIVIAYEPVWAIGTGKTATPAQAQEVHKFVRAWLKDHVSQAVADATRIIYGGSVNPANSDELAKEQDIDGFLVGGASLVAEKFIPIINSVKEKKH